MTGVDVAHIPKPERYAGNGNGDGEEGGSNGPSKNLGTVKKLFSRSDVPADLKVHRKSANEDPDSH